MRRQVYKSEAAAQAKKIILLRFNFDQIPLSQLLPIDLILFQPRLERGVLSLFAGRTLQVLTKKSFGICTRVKPHD